MPVSRLAALALAAGCAAVTAQTPEAPSSAVAAVENSVLDSPLFYQLLIGEIELHGGNAGTAFQVMLDAARKTRDERLFRRAADVALEAKAGDEALVAVRAWRQATPRSLEAHRYEVQLLVALNRIADTAEPLASTLALVPRHELPDAIAALPRTFARTTDRQAAAAVLEKLLLPYAQAQGGDAPPAAAAAAWTALGRSRLAAGDPKRALEAARRAQALLPSGEGAALLATELMRSEPDAEDLVRRFLAAQPPADAAPRSAVRLVYARSLALVQRYGDAAPQIEAVTREAPQLVEAWLTLGALRLELKQAAEAEQALREFLARAEREEQTVAARGETAELQDDEATPAQRRAQAYLMLAQAAELRGDFKAAGAWLDQVDGSQAFAVQSRRASLLAQQGRLDEGRALLRGLPERDPQEARAKMLAEAHLLRDGKQWGAAFDVFAAASARFGDDTDLLYEQAMMAEKLDRIDHMEQLLRRVIAIKPDHAASYNALGYTFADRNVRLPEARELIVKAMALTPGDPYLTDSMGWVEYRLGNRDAAIKWLREAYRARPDIEIAAHLGEVLWVSGQRDEARRIWSEARARDAGNEVLKETLARLKVDL